MPTAFTHAFFGLALGKAVYRRPMPWKFWSLAAVCSAFPDMDVGLHAFGVEFEDPWGHRGMMHSLLFAAALAMFVTTVFFRREAAVFSKEWWKYTTFFFTVTASHGVLDALSNGGIGIAFFSPFDQSRYFLPFRPVEVAPIGLSSFLSRRGWVTMQSEWLWIWLPTIAMLGVVMGVRAVWRVKRKRESEVGGQKPDR